MFWLAFGCQSSNNLNGPRTRLAKLSVSIHSPQEGLSTPQNALIPFTATAIYGENGEVNEADIIWQSDRDGIIGVGSAFSRSGLSVGRHRITLLATGPGGEIAAAQTRITVTANPGGMRVTIASPPAGAPFAAYEPIPLHGRGKSADGQEITAALSYTWISHRDGILGNGAEIAPAGLSPGVHRITLAVTDDSTSGGGQEESAQIEVVILPDTSAAPLQVDILSPQDGARFPQGQTITFVGAASQADGTPITTEGIAWVSSVDGQVGIGESFNVAGLSVGFHRMAMIASTPDGRQKAATSILIEILP